MGLGRWQRVVHVMGESKREGEANRGLELGGM
jgi:hypothetical protein